MCLYVYIGFNLLQISFIVVQLSEAFPSNWLTLLSAKKKKTQSFFKSFGTAIAFLYTSAECVSDISENRLVVPD